MPVGEKAFFPCDRFEVLKKQIAAAAKRLAKFSGVTDIIFHKTQPAGLKARLNKAL